MKCIHKKYINILHKYLPTKKMIGPYCHYSIQQQKIPFSSVISMGDVDRVSD